MGELVTILEDLDLNSKSPPDFKHLKHKRLMTAAANIPESFSINEILIDTQLSNDDGSTVTNHNANALKEFQSREIPFPIMLTDRKME